MKTNFATVTLLLAFALSTKAAPIAFEEVSLLVRTHETDSFISREVMQRRLVRALTPQQEAILKTQGASDSLIQALRNPTVSLSDSEAMAFDSRREQAEIAFQQRVLAEAAAREAALDARMRNLQTTEADTRVTAGAITPPAIPYQVPTRYPQPLTALSSYPPPIAASALGRSLPPLVPSPIGAPATIQSSSHLGLPIASLGVLNTNRYDPNSLANPYGAGNPFKADGLMNPYSQYGSRFSNNSWTNPYATNAPKLYGADGSYHGRLSTNPYAPDSTSNQFGYYGNPFSPESINNPFGAGNPFSTRPIYVRPQ